MDKAAFKLQLRKIRMAMDEVGLDAFVNSLHPDDVEQYKGELANAWCEIYSIWYYDFVCGKVIMVAGPDVFFSSLLDMLAAAEKLDPAVKCYSERADCYRELAELKNNQEEQLCYIEKAILEISAALEDQSPDGRLYMQMVNVLLDKIKISNQFTDEEFVGVLGYYELALPLYSGVELPFLLYECFRILDFPFSKKQHWHDVFMEKTNKVLYSEAGNNRLVYLEWSNELARLVDNESDYIPPAYLLELTKQSVNLLKPLIHFETDNTEHLNKLGAAFKRAAKQIDPDAFTDALHYYEVALKYFTKGQDINPADSMFPVDATNVTECKAVISECYQNDLSRAIEDEDFKDIKQEIISIDNNKNLNAYYDNKL